MQPLITVALAVYRTHPEYLEQQIKSIGTQTYDNIELCVFDDSVDNEKTAMILRRFLNAYINFPVTLIISTENLGSVKAFDTLTRRANGDWIAYCDHDDVWHPEKLTTLLKVAQRRTATLVYSDMRIIDEDGLLIANSLKEHSPHIHQMDGEHLDKILLYRNFVTGCTMMVKRGIAQAALPFPDCYVHDHWLAYVASKQGCIAFFSNALIDYRLHGKNQIGMSRLLGVADKSDYIAMRLIPEQKRIEFLSQHYGYQPDILKRKREIATRLSFLKDPNPKIFLDFILHCRINPLRFFFEISLVFLPSRLIKKAIKLIRNK